MKKFILLTIMSILALNSLNAQTSQVGKFVTYEWLNNYYYDTYKIISGGYDDREEFYPNTTFEGYNNGVKHEIKTDRQGRVHSIVLTFSNIKSETELRNIVDNYLTGYRASIFEKTDSNNRLYIRSKLPSSVMDYKTMDITAAWDYNGYGQFFFNYMRIFFL